MVLRAILTITVAGVAYFGASSLAGAEPQPQSTESPAPKTAPPTPPQRPALVIPEPKRALGPGIIEDLSKVKVPPAPLEITIDVSQVEKEYPEIRKWALNAETICKAWYPILCDELQSEGFKPRDRVTFLFVPKQGAPAATGGGRITVSTDWVIHHPDDYGMMVHELTHVVQAYGGGGNNRDIGWLTEAIADYTRFYRYEADPTHGGISATSKYNAPYRAGAAFLYYLVEHYDRNIVKKLNAAMRNGGFDDAGLRKLIAEDADVKAEDRKDLDTLFKAFVEAHLDKHPSRPRTPAPKGG